MKGLVIFDLDMTLIDTREIEQLKIERKWTEIRQNHFATNVYAGIHDCLNFLDNNDIKVAVATTFPKEGYAIPLLRYHNILVNEIVGYHDVSYRKPYPDSILFCINKLGIKDKLKVIYIGDEREDILAARRAGVLSIGALWGSSNVEYFNDINPDYIADKPTDLMDILKEFYKIEDSYYDLGNYGNKLHYKYALDEEVTLLFENGNHFYVTDKNYNGYLVSKNRLGESIFLNLDKNMNKTTHSEYVKKRRIKFHDFKLYDEKILCRFARDAIINNGIFLSEKLHESAIIYCNDYYPKWHYQHDIDDFTQKILDLKNGNNTEYFIKILESLINLDNKELALVVFPSSEPYKYGALYRIVDIICTKYGLINASKCLQRYRSVSQSKYNERSVKKHIESIRLINMELLKNKFILVIDDITTTHNSFKAAKIIILSSGLKYKNLKFLSFAKTADRGSSY